MLIGIVGDTHGDYECIKQMLAKNCLVEHWLHTGDFMKDAEVLAQKSKVVVTAVAGNNDYPKTLADYNKLLTIAGKKIWLTHGHKYLARGKNSLLYKAQELAVDIAIYGHTHIPEIIDFDDLLLINPGSPSYPRGGSKKGFVLLELEENQKPRAKFIALN